MWHFLLKNRSGAGKGKLKMMTKLTLQQKSAEKVKKKIRKISKNQKILSKEKKF